MYIYIGRRWLTDLPIVGDLKAFFTFSNKQIPSVNTSAFLAVPFIRFLLFYVSYNLWNSSCFYSPFLALDKQRKNDFKKFKFFVFVVFETKHKLFICFNISCKSNFKTIITTLRQRKHFLRKTKVFLRGSNKSMKMTKVSFFLSFFLSKPFLHSKQQVNTASQRRCSAI